MIRPTPPLQHHQHNQIHTSQTINTTPTSTPHPTTPITTNDNPDSYGHHHHHKPSSSFRIYFQNINGLKWDTHLTDATQTIQTLQELQVDAFGLAETNLDFQQPSVLHRLHQTTRNLYQRQLHLTTSSSQVKFPTPYKPGGTITATTGWWTSRIISKGEDPSGTGCWSYTKLRARQNRLIVIITVYRLSPQTSSSQLGPYTVFSQLQQTLNQRSSIDPRKQFDNLLHQQLQSWIDDHHEIILMIDANEPTYNPPRHFSSIIHNLHLTDVFQHVHQNSEGITPEFPTHERGSRRIDYIFVSPTLLTYIKQCGYLSFSDSLDSDHRGIFTDFDIHGLFGPRDTIPPPDSRIITSKHAHRIRNFLTNLTTKLEQKHITSRIQSLQQASIQGILSDYHQRRYDAIDKDITNAILHAETASYRNSQIHPWSPKLRDAGLTVRYWKLRLRHLKTGKNLTPRIQHLQQKLLITDTANNSILSVTTMLQRSQTTLKEIRNNATTHRSTFLQDLATFKAEQHKDQTHASIILRIQQCELQKAAYTRCSSILNSSKRSGLTRLQVPTASITSPTNLQPNTAAIHQYPETSNTWTEVTTKEDIEAHLIARNRTHYRQANNTPFGTTSHGQALEFLGTNSISQSILLGTYPGTNTAHLHPASQAYIRNLKFHPEVAAGNVINPELTTSTLRQTFQHWRETTSTSPSGRHLGLYKAIFLNHPINEQNPTADAITAIVQLALTSNLLPTCWLQIVSVCLEKKPGQPQTDKIRIIHLFEADFNGLLKFLWGRKLVHHAEQIKAYPDSQHGSRPGRSAITASLIKTLAFNNSIILRNTMCLVDNDATACYDRIPNSLGSICCQRIGMPPQAENLHNNVLLNAKYHIKTAYGISNSTYQGTNENPLQGQGQGSGNAPATWNSVMSPMWITLDELISDYFISENPQGGNHVTTKGNSFVDDTSLFFNIRLTRSTPPDQTTMVRFTDMVQTWERILYTTGGALKPPKCFWFALFWIYSGVTPRAKFNSEIQMPLIITDSNTGNIHEIPLKSINQAERTLGVRICPTGNMTAEFNWIYQKAYNTSLQLHGHRLKIHEIYMAYNSYFIPRISYSLPVTTFTNTQCQKIQSLPTQTFLTALGFNKNFPRAVVYGPTSHGGLGFRDLSIEQGTLRLCHFLAHLRKQDTAGRMYSNNLSFLQLASGIGRPLLQDTVTPLPYLPPNDLVLATRNFLHTIQATIHLPAEDNFSPSRHNDCFIMETILTLEPNRRRLENINACRLYLQITNLSDISTGDGMYLLPEIMKGDPPHSSISEYLWPRQHKPPNTSWQIWRSTLRRAFLSNRNTLQLNRSCRLGRWNHHRTPSRRHLYLIDITNRQLIIKINNTYTFHHIHNYHCKHPIALRIPIAPPTHTATTIANTLSNAVPATITHATHTYFIISFHRQPPHFHNLQTSHISQIPSPMTPSFEPQWERDILVFHQQISTPLTHPTLFQLLHSATPIYIATATDKHPDKFGWSIGSLNQPLWHGSSSFTNHNDPSTTSRQHLLGFLAAIQFLRQHSSNSNTPFYHRTLHLYIPTMSIKKLLTTHYTDNTSPLKYISPQYDITATIFQLRTQHNLHFHFTNAKQNPTAYQTLLTAATQAITYLPATTIPTQPLPLLRAYLNLPHFTERDLPSSIRQHASFQLIQPYILNKSQLSIDAWENIDWTIHSKSIQSLPHNHRHQITKFIHRWLPTFQKLHQQKRHPTPICPCCTVVPETNDHVLHCRWQSDPDFRTTHITQLQTILQTNTIDLPFHHLLINHIDSWLTDSPSETPIEQLIDNPTHVPYHCTIDTQSAIGWDNFFRCRFTPLLHHHQNTTDSKYTKFMLQLAHWVWTTILDAWKLRNHHVFHTTDAQAAEVKRVRLADRIHHTYHECKSLPHHLRNNLLSRPLDQLMSSHIDTLTLWLTQAESSLRQHRKCITRGHHRQSITNYFKPIQTAAPNH